MPERCKDGFPPPPPAPPTRKASGLHSLTMRQYYKAAAIQGMLASDTGNNFTVQQVVDWAAELADFAIEEDRQHQAGK